MKIPAHFIEQKVHVALRHVLQTPKGMAFLSLMGNDKSFPTLVSVVKIDDVKDASIVLRYTTDSILGPPGDYAVDLETVQTVGAVSAIIQNHGAKIQLT